MSRAPLSSWESCLFALQQDRTRALPQVAESLQDRTSAARLRPQTPLQGNNPKYQDVSLQKFPLGDIFQQQPFPVHGIPGKPGQGRQLHLTWLL